MSDATAAGWPAAALDRDRFVLDRRGPRPAHDPFRAQGAFIEPERSSDGRVVQVATILLTGRECPWRCAMCDLWRGTTEGDIPAGAVPAQVAAARQTLDAHLAPGAHIKLYNAGSFFDPRSVPERDYDAVAAALRGFARVIVESHPALVGARVQRLLDALGRHRASGAPAAALEVAMGLETAHPAALERLHKRMTLNDFGAAADRLGAAGVALRVFLLVSPPFVPEAEQDAWLLRSVDAAIAFGATAVSLVPTRSGNGALDALSRAGLFIAPRLADVERSAALALAHAHGRVRVFADVWDLARFADCRACAGARRERLSAMNLEQRALPPVPCDACGGGRPS
jgi:radical SAM enzyme (TIGR01210 family)